jgi:hypothetical protein
MEWTLKAIFMSLQAYYSQRMWIRCDTWSHKKIKTKNFVPGDPPLVCVLQGGQGTIGWALRQVKNIDTCI